MKKKNYILLTTAILGILTTVPAVHAATGTSANNAPKISNVTDDGDIDFNGIIDMRTKRLVYFVGDKPSWNSTKVKDYARALFDYMDNRNHPDQHFGFDYFMSHGGWYGGYSPLYAEDGTFMMSGEYHLMFELKGHPSSSTIPSLGSLIVKKFQPTIFASDSTISVGDTWKPEDNFDKAALRINGKNGVFDLSTFLNNQGEIVGDVDTTKPGDYLVVYKIRDGSIKFESASKSIHVHVVPKAAANVTVHYQDENGKSIAKDAVLTGNVGDSYTAEQIQIKGYTFKEAKGSVKGTFSDKAQEVTLVYTKDSSDNGKSDDNNSDKPDNNNSGKPDNNNSGKPDNNNNSGNSDNDSKLTPSNNDPGNGNSGNGAGSKNATLSSSAASSTNTASNGTASPMDMTHSGNATHSASNTATLPHTGEKVSKVMPVVGGVILALAALAGILTKWKRAKE